MHKEGPWTLPDEGVASLPILLPQMEIERLAYPFYKEALYSLLIDSVFLFRIAMSMLNQPFAPMRCVCGHHHVMDLAFLCFSFLMIFAILVVFCKMQPIVCNILHLTREELC